MCVKTSILSRSNNISDQVSVILTHFIKMGKDDTNGPTEKGKYQISTINGEVGKRRNTFTNFWNYLKRKGDRKSLKG